MPKKVSFKGVILSLIVLVFIGLLFCPPISAQLADNWIALSPYNTLWPLWSPALSQVDPATGLPAPIITSITPSTVLPVQPGLTWHFSLGHPWLLYNTPMGLAYYDPWIGINLWPPDILISVLTGQPITISLPSTYATLPPTPSWWIFSSVPAANGDYLVAYPNFTGALPAATIVPPPPTLNSLLTASGLW